MMHRADRTTALIGATLLLICVGADASELSVRAPVVSVEPITEAAKDVEHCDPKPVGASLGETLAWDLGLDCRTERVASSRVTGYRVFYRWDDRVYSQVMAREPGDSIPLTVRLN